MKYTVFFDQINRINYQVKAKDKYEAATKAFRLYRRVRELPTYEVQENWIVDSEGEDK